MPVDPNHPRRSRVSSATAGPGFRSGHRFAEFLLLLVFALVASPAFVLAAPPEPTGSAQAATGGTAAGSTGATGTAVAGIELLAYEVSTTRLVTWVVIGLLVGSTVGPLFTRRLSGFGTISNIAIGLLGAVLGGFLLDVLRLRFDLGSIEIAYDELLNAFVGALVLLFAYVWVRGRSADEGRRRTRTR